MILFEAQSHFDGFMDRFEALYVTLTAECMALRDQVQGDLEQFEALLLGGHADIPAEDLVNSIAVALSQLEQCAGSASPADTSGMSTGAKVAFAFLGLMGLAGLGIIWATRKE